MKHLPIGPAQSIDIRINKQANGSKYWHQLYNTPEYGILCKGLDLSNKKTLGYGYIISGFVLLPLVKTERFSWSVDMAVGVGYVTRPFDYKTNYQNIAIGSHLNAFLMLGQKVKYRLSNRLTSTAGFSYNHLSNGGTILPNLGLNYPMISLGIERRFGPNDSTSKQIFKDQRIESNWEIGIYAGFKQTSANRGKFYPAFSLVAQRTMSLGRRSSIAIGINSFYNSSHIPTIEARGESISAIENIQLGPHLAYQLHIDKLQVSLAMGLYIYDQLKTDGLVFNRMALKYYLNHWLGINLSIKTHYFKADYIELGTSFRF